MTSPLPSKYKNARNRRATHVRHHTAIASSMLLPRWCNSLWGSGRSCYTTLVHQSRVPQNHITLTSATEIYQLKFDFLHSTCTIYIVHGWRVQPDSRDSYWTWEMRFKIQMCWPGTDWHTLPLHAFPLQPTSPSILQHTKGAVGRVAKT